VSEIRFLFRAAALAAGLLISSSTLVHAQGAPPLATLRIASASDDDVTPILYAQQAGLFRRAGLEVVLQRSGSGAQIAAAVAGGAVDIGKSSMMTLASAHARGLPFVLIAPSGMYVTKTPSAMLLVLSNSPIHTARDLTGKTLPATALKDLMQVATQSWVDKNGGDSKSLHFIEMPAAAIPTALDEGRVDAATMYYPVLSTALASGKYRVLAHPLDAIGPSFLIAAWFTTTETLAKHKAEIATFVRVLRDASAYANAHHAETVPLIATFAGTEPATIARMTRATAGLTLDAHDIQPLIDASAAYNVFDKAFDARELIGAP
jgi:NitT/TauT family transport system substrate-binding protein